MIVLLNKFLLSIALGALIGIEREKKKHKEPGRDFTGIRTFMFTSLLGTLSAYIADKFFPNVLLVMIFAFVALTVIGYVLSAQLNKDLGMTTELSTIVGFFIGIICYTGPMLLAVVLAIITTLVLSLKDMIHHYVNLITTQEFYDGIKFLIIAFVILPQLPNEPMGFLSSFNPYEIWLMVVFVSGVSFGGYMLTKYFGTEKGIGLTGILGGFASSTAVVTSMAHDSKQVPDKHISPLVFAAVIASSTMFLRVLFEVFVLNRSLVPYLIVPLVGMSIAGFIPALIMWKHNSKDTAKLDLKTPLSLTPALKFGIFYTLILLLTKLGQTYLGNKGIYLASFISGFADVDAITIFIARHANEISPSVAVLSITLAATVNTLSKVFIAMLFGTRAFKRNIAVMLGVIVFVGIFFMFAIAR